MIEERQQEEACAFASISVRGNPLGFLAVIPRPLLEIQLLLQHVRLCWRMCRIEIAMLTNAQIGSEIAFSPLTCFANVDLSPVANDPVLIWTYVVLFVDVEGVLWPGLQCIIVLMHR